MTKFENEMLEKLLFMKEREIEELAKDENLKLKKEAIEELAYKIKLLQTELFFVETHKYSGF